MKTENLHKKFVQLGRKRLHLKNEMLALLPEIYETEIYKKYASSIVEYAGKYGDIARSTVIKRLRLEKNLENKPFLKESIRKVGVHKVAMVANIASPETDRAWADKVENMSKSAVQTLAKEMREKRTKSSDKCCAVGEKIKIELDEEMTFMFLKLKKEMGENLSNKEIMRMILAKSVTGETLTKQTKHYKKSKKRVNKSSIKSSQSKKQSRPISAPLKRETFQKTNHKCAYPGCNKPAENIHHPERFAKTQTHENLQPLCKPHHEFMHNGLVQNETEQVDEWKIQLTPRPNSKIDNLYRKHRQEALL